MAIGDLRPEDLNELSESSQQLGETFQKASMGAFTLTEEAAGLLGILKELHGTLDFVARNPLISFTFFERIGRTIQKDIIQNLRETKNLTQEQIVQWNKWGSAVNYTASAVLSFATKIAYLQQQMRVATIDMSRFFNLNNIPYGSRFENVYQLEMHKAIQTMTMNAEFAQTTADVKRALGRYITPQIISQLTGLGTAESRTAYETYMKRISLYTRAFPEANIPELTKRLYEQLGGFGMSPSAAIESSIYLATQAAEGRMIPTAGVGENINTLMRLMASYQSKGIRPDIAYKMAQSAVFGLGGLRDANNQPLLPAERISEFAELYPGVSPEREIIMKALGVRLPSRDRYLGEQGPLVFLQALQRWAKENRLSERPREEVQEIITKAKAEKLGISYEELIKLASMPDITFNLKELNNLVSSIEKLKPQQVKTLKESIEGISDPYAKKLEELEKRTQNLPDFLSGVFSTITTGVAKFSEDIGISPIVPQTAVSGLAIYGAYRAGRAGTRKLASSVGREIARHLGGKIATEVAEEVTEEVGKRAVTSFLPKTSSRLLRGFGVVSKILGPIGTILTAYEITKLMTDQVTEFSQQQMAENEYNRLLGAETAVGGSITTTPGGFKRSQDISTKAIQAYTDFKSKVSSTKAYPKGLSGILAESRGEEKLAETSSNKPGTLHVIFSTESGMSLGDAMAQAGKDTFIRIKVGEVLNSLSQA